MSKELIIAIIGSSAFGSIVTAVIEYFKNKSAMAQAVQMLLYTDIKISCEEFIALGKISSDDLEVLVKKHKIYHDKLKGNGYLDTLMNKVQQLPITKD